MKKVIRASISNAGREWINSSEMNYLLEECTDTEKKLVGKIINSRDPKSYADAVADTLIILDARMTGEFTDILNKCLEIF